MLIPGQVAAKNDSKPEDDEMDDWDKRIFSTGCANENTAMNDCFFDKKDWRKCAGELKAFSECWKRKGNDERTDSKTAPSKA
ncbi:MAG: hypothetical protein M1814_006181 [Vezdaea aestivalis]|nr:MAG: hypothetical protein M1814_006181 [Vezdaea aestivalis]